jgi:hypothetical protein
MLPTRTLGTQGLTVSAIGLGLMGMSQAYGTRAADGAGGPLARYRAAEQDPPPCDGPLRSAALLAA